MLYKEANVSFTGAQNVFMPACNNLCTKEIVTTY
jgi:hypothetical protein